MRHPAPQRCHSETPRTFDCFLGTRTRVQFPRKQGLSPARTRRIGRQKSNQRRPTVERKSLRNPRYQPRFKIIIERRARMRTVPARSNASTKRGTTKRARRIEGIKPFLSITRSYRNFHSPTTSSLTTSITLTTTSTPRRGRWRIRITWRKVTSSTSGYRPRRTCSCRDWVTSRSRPPIRRPTFNRSYKRTRDPEGRNPRTSNPLATRSSSCPSIS